MARVVRPEEFGAVSSLPGPQRYEYFLKRVVDAEEVWLLRSASGWIVASDDDGVGLFPVWSDEAYAQACREGEWAESEPTSIPLEEWRAKWLPELERDGRRVAVFPVRGGVTGVSVDPHRLLEDIDAEEGRY